MWQFKASSVPGLSIVKRPKRSLEKCVFTVSKIVELILILADCHIFVLSNLVPRVLQTWNYPFGFK